MSFPELASIVRTLAGRKHVEYRDKIATEAVGREWHFAINLRVSGTFHGTKIRNAISLTHEQIINIRDRMKKEGYFAAWYVSGSWSVAYSGF